MRCLALVAIAFVVVSAPAFAAERPRVVVLAVSASTEKLARLAASVTEQVLTELERPGVIEVMGASDVAAALGLERQRQMLGCSDATNACLAEVSAAMGAPWLVTGALSQSGKTLRLDLKLVRATDGKVFFRDGQSIRDESAVYDVVAALVGRLLDRSDFRLPPAPATVVEAHAPLEEVAPPVVSVSPAPAPPARSRAGAWATIGAGAATVAAGAIVFAVGAGLVQRTQENLAGVPASVDDTRVLDYPTARARLNEGTTQQLVGGVLAAAGLLAAAGGVGWLVLGDDVAPANVRLTLTSHGLLASGRF